MKVTRIAYSRNLNPGKFTALSEQAALLGRVRSEVWERCGVFGGHPIGTVNEWMASGLGNSFGTLATPWKATVRDAVADIDASLAAAKVSVKRAIWLKTEEEESERKRLFTLLKTGRWAEDPWLHRQMRNRWSGGTNHTFNQIVVRSDNYTVRGNWLAVPSLVRGKTIKIPLRSEIPAGRNLRLILRDERIEIHYSEDVEVRQDCGTRTIGVDQGYTEVLVDSDGEHHGEALGTLLTKESDTRKVKGQRRARLRSIANNTKNRAKAERIRTNNLGRKKANRRNGVVEKQIKTVTYTAVHSVVDKAAVVVAEDLSKPFTGKSLGRNVNRRLSGWTKGVTAEALERVSERRGSVLRLVNAAYTSQTCACHGALGRRSGDKFYCSQTGACFHADENAAVSVLNRMSDSEITLYTPYREVKRIIQARTTATDETAHPGHEFSRQADKP